MTLKVQNLSTTAAGLERPFSLLQLATVGDLALSVFVCQGQIHWHRHLDEDELFLVHEGVVTLDTQRGRLMLHSEELAVVPKGLSHRTSSQLRSVVVLIRPAVLTERKNGHRHTALGGEPPLEKVRLARVGNTLGDAYRAATLARVEDFDVLLMSAQGFGPSESAAPHGALWLVVRGSVGVEVDGGAGARLEAGELTVVPAGTTYRLSAAQPSLVITLARASGPAE